MEGDGDAETNREPKNKSLSGARGECKAQTEEEGPETCLGLSEVGGHCFRSSMVREAALVNVGSCILDVGTSERQSSAKTEVSVSTSAG